ncbi:PilZ domain-containing protein [Thiomicrorhabdus sp. ZW0627]|uniref:PilZ domain-containing protein n=1 Tax=Thiomicrorhabdus sp. ZW0627 TaxID=3039774 RepID=UPI0024366B0B|nr:PilZ domain-containing protein [Thiomicrorhabdus sp. ZW0627]MDG6773155.1 PilZ domain-containing protein [Thiomicrorhabdus sp. ZW0627]
MPGTHYDSDHSFIEALPFEYKKIAYRILRSSSLEIMLLDLRSQYSKHFELFKATEPLDVDYVEKTICACIVAKITSFSKGLFISEIHFQFLQEVLYKALGVVLERPGAENEVIDNILADAHPKTLHWIQKDKDDHGKHSLAIRSRRENTRRYFRYQANMSYHFIRIGNHEKVEDLQGDIYSSGVKHFNKIVNEKLDTIVVNYSKNIKSSLQESYPEAYDLFMVVLEKLEYLREVLNGISVGILDISNAMRFLQENVKNVLDYDSLQGNIRTESILRDFEEKLNQLNNHTITLLENSTPHKLYEGPMLQKMKIDHDIRGYVEKNKKNGSKLLKAFIDLYHYTLLMEKIYNNISSSNYIIIFPEYWSQEYQDISPGGFAFYSEFLVERNDILELFFRIDISKTEIEEFEIIHQRAKVVRIEPKPDLGRYLIACEFMTVPEETVMLISHAIQGLEVKDAYNSSGLLDEDDAFGV